MDGKHGLIERAEEIIRSINLDELNRAGIIRNRESYDFIVQYPPPLLMKPAAAETFHA